MTAQSEPEFKQHAVLHKGTLICLQVKILGELQSAHAQQTNNIPYLCSSQELCLFKE